MSQVLTCQLQQEPDAAVSVPGLGFGSTLLLIRGDRRWCWLAIASTGLSCLLHMEHGAREASLVPGDPSPVEGGSGEQAMGTLSPGASAGLPEALLAAVLLG